MQILTNLTPAPRSQERGHITSAAESYLRAVEYYRQSEYFLRENLDDSRCLETAQRMQASHQHFMTLLDASVL